MSNEKKVFPFHFIINDNRLPSDDDGNREGTGNKSLAMKDTPVIIFNMMYYLGFCPFNLKRGKHGIYDVRKWLPQQLICGFVTISTTISRITDLRRHWPEAEDGNPASYFKLFFHASNFSVHLACSLIIWHYSEEIRTIINFFHRMHPQLQNSRLRAKVTIAGVGVCVGCIIVCIICFVFGTDIFELSHWDPLLLYKCTSEHAKYTYFLSDKIVCTEEMANKQLSIEETVLASIFGVGVFFRKIVGFYENVLCGIAPFILWIATKEFVDSLSSPHKWATVSARYKELKQLSDLANRTFGPLIISHFMVAFFFYSSNLVVFISTVDMLARVKFMAYYVIFLSTLFFASEVCRQMDQLALWISENINNEMMTDLSQKELALVLHEIQANRISITACGVFTLTYSLSAQMTGVIITYFVISVQYRSIA